MDFKVVIPARYESSRLPGKALLKVKGKPIIQYVYENACKSDADQVVIATDDHRIEDAAKAFNAEVCLTSNQQKSGTDRIAEVANKYFWGEDIAIVNVQGDEPLMPAENIKQVAEYLMMNSAASMSTLCAPIANKDELENPNVVKVNFDKNNIAIIFSRKIETFNIERSKNTAIFRHLGIYAYRVGFLKLFTQLPPSKLEKQESLEQLRALENGYSIYVDICKSPAGIGVDTPEDYESLLDIM